jgi:PAS domain S-box-containing protein
LEPRVLRAYAFVVVVSVAALAFNLSVRPFIGPTTLPAFLIATLVSAWYGGLGPGIAATAVTALLNTYFFLSAERTLVIHDATGAVRLGLYVASALVVAFVAARLRAAQHGAQAREAVARRHEQELARSEARFRSLIELAPDGIVMANPTGRIVLANAQAHRMFGYDPGGLVGQAIEALVPERARAGHAAHRARYHASPRTRPMGIGLELGGVRRDGSEFPVEISLSLIETDEGPLAISLVRDVSDRRQIEARVRQLNVDLEHRVAELAAVNGELEAFSYSVSHDLRAPLRAIDGFSLALLEDHGARLDEEARDHLARVRAAAQRMAELIDDLLDLSRVTRRTMERQRVDVSAIARAIVEQLQRSAPGRAVDLAIADGIAAEGDDSLLRVALENLLGNAWKFTGHAPRARIEFGVVQRDGLPTYFVADNGVGFDMAHAGKLFGPFQRLHGMQEFPGTGIGLATVQRIVQRHGGRVWAEARPGQGATFYFTLSEGSPKGV